MAKKFFTTESFNTLISEIKAYVTDGLSNKADTDHTHETIVVGDTQPTTSCLWFNTSNS